MTVTDDCDPHPEVRFFVDGVEVNKVPHRLPEEAQTVDVRATDHDGNTAFLAGVSVLVRDTVAPEVTLSVSPDHLWPPSHDYRDVQLTISVADVCSQTFKVTVVAKSSEDDDDPSGGDGATTNDISSTRPGRT